MKHSQTVGNLFQLVGLVLLPIGLLGGLSGGSLHLELTLLGIGGASFIAGRKLSGK